MLQINPLKQKYEEKKRKVGKAWGEKNWIYIYRKGQSQQNDKKEKKGEWGERMREMK